MFRQGPSIDDTECCPTPPKKESRHATCEEFERREDVFVEIRFHLRETHYNAFPVGLLAAIAHL